MRMGWDEIWAWSKEAWNGGRSNRRSRPAPSSNLTSLILAFSRCWQDGIKYVLRIIPNGELHAWKQQSTKAPPEVPLVAGRAEGGTARFRRSLSSLLSPEALGN